MVQTFWYILTVFCLSQNSFHSVTLDWLIKVRELDVPEMASGSSLSPNLSPSLVLPPYFSYYGSGAALAKSSSIDLMSSPAALALAATTLRSQQRHIPCATVSLSAAVNTKVVTASSLSWSCLHQQWRWYASPTSARNNQRLCRGTIKAVKIEFKLGWQRCSS